jgi:hypothetical protein
MKKLLVVGCGGSGGATLAYMMDQLRSDLAAYGVDRLPAGWQFVHLDVPVGPSSVPGVGNVREQGGVYLATGPESDSYRVLDNAMSQRLGAEKALDTIATWAPRQPEAVHTPLSTGAGQYRALGRMITLSRLEQVRVTLDAAWKQLSRTETTSAMRSLDIPGSGGFDPNEPPLVLVVSSMAGGAGASMALDVCRVLTMIPGVDPKLMSVFMVTPDIFEALPKSAVTGTSPNALAMLGEIVASQTGSAKEHDVSLMRALGVENGEGEITPFARVFPVGRYVGANRTIFGDGTPNAVYRGLGRGLAALTLSGSAMQQFVEWDLTNAVGDQGSREFLGWGNKQWNNVPWGSFGFASLSMGRDRYAEYSAQRLARAAVDKLLHGHLQSGNPASGDEQVKALLDNQWDYLCYQFGLPTPAEAAMGIGGWVSSRVLPGEPMSQQTYAVIGQHIRPMIDQRPGVHGEQWAARIFSVLGESRNSLLGAADQIAYRTAFHWQQGFVQALERTTADAMAARGLPYATGLVKRIARTLQNEMQPGLTELERYMPADVADVPPDVRALLTGLRGTLNDPSQPTERVLDGVRRNLEQQIYANLSGKLALAVGVLVEEVIDPLVAALDEAQTLLRQAEATPRESSCLALLQTDEYAAWPSDRDDRVADRFAEADNEVMLTPSTAFKQRYQLDLPQSVDLQPDPRGFGQAVGIATTQVITGLWPTLDGRPAPGVARPTIERTRNWVSRAFPWHPDTGDSLMGQPAGYDVHLRTGELLDRARRFVGRADRAFHDFCSVSLRDYVSGADVPESERTARRRDLLLRFGEAIDLARPLASVNENAMQAIHEVRQMAYRYKFSSVPFRGLPVADDMVAQLISTSRIDENCADAFTRALTDEAKLKRIDIFGSYPNYSPLAYTSVIEPAVRQWQSATPGARKAFWERRRARPLAASLPMHQRERRAMVAGWILGRSIGAVAVPKPPYDQPARVWDTIDQRWLAFPNPLLTPPSEFLADYDWLPAVLESVLLAIAHSHQSPVMTSMYPYRALRRIYDAGIEDDTSGLSQGAATTNLANWLRTGDLGTGVGSVIPETGPKTSADQRADRLRTYLEEYGTFVGHYYMRPGAGADAGRPGAPGGGTFSTITVRPQATNTPVFRDLAEDVYWATGRLSGLIDTALTQAKQPTAGVPNPPIDPSAGPDQFQVPKGSIF